MSSAGSSPAHYSDEERDDDLDGPTAPSLARRNPIKLPENDESDEDNEEAPRHRRGPSDVKREPFPTQRSRDDLFDEDEEEISPAPRSNSGYERERRYADNDDDDDVGDGYSDDDDHHRRVSKKKVKSEKRLARSKRRDNSDDEYGSEDEGESGIETKKQKKRKKNEFDDPPPEENDVEEKQKKMSSFERAVEKTKANRRRRNEPDPHVLEQECVAFLERMKKARDDDLRSFKKGQPALEKIKMLRDVEKMMAKVYHREFLLDNMLLAAFRSWLDRLPDGSLPNIQVRTTLLNILFELRIDEDWVDRLEGSQGLGKVIHFLSRNDEHEPNKRLAEKIMMKWARPVYNMNSNFQELLDEFDKPNEGYRAGKESVAAERKAAMKTVQRMKTTEEKLMELRRGKEGNRIMASVPRPAPFLFTTVAEGSIQVDEATEREMRANNAKRRKMSRTISNLRRLSKQGGSRGSRPSINGR